jgi:hypothetical protein
VSGSVDLAVEIPATVVADLNRLIGAADGNSEVYVKDNCVYLGSPPESPKIGDVRAWFTEVKPATISILANVAGDTLEPLIDDNSSIFTDEGMFSMVSMGTVSKDEMYGDAIQDSKAIMWGSRICSLPLVSFGLMMFLGALSVLPGPVSFLPGLAWALFLIGAIRLGASQLYGGLSMGAGGALAVFALLALFPYMKRKRNP